MNGTVGVFGATAEFDATPIDIIENIGELVKLLDGIYMGAGELRYGDFGFLYDVFYIDVFSSNDIDRRFINGSIDVGFKKLMVTLAGSYRVYEADNGYLDALAGFQVTEVVRFTKVRDTAVNMAVQ